MRQYEIRAAGDGFSAGENRIGGYAALFNSDTTIADSFIESIAPGAFDAAMSQDVRALVDHDAGRVIGRTSSGTLRLSQDERGLAVEIDLPDTQDGRDLATLIGRGDVSGMSFGFRVTGEAWDFSGDMPKRTITNVDLFEVSVVAFPAYEDTSIALRSLDKAKRANNYSSAALRLRMKADLDIRSRGKPGKG